MKSLTGTECFLRYFTHLLQRGVFKESRLRWDTEQTFDFNVFHKEKSIGWCSILLESERNLLYAKEKKWFLQYLFLRLNMVHVISIHTVHETTKL